jgi:hypothetical protein
MTLYPKKTFAIKLLVMCVTIVAMGLLLAQSHPWIGYPLAGFFGLCIPLAVVVLLPGSTYLRIEEDGLTISNLFRKTLFLWDVIDEFLVVELKRRGVNVGKIVGFNCVQSYDRFAAGRRRARAINQCEVALPGDYGMKVEELAELLNSKLQEYRQTSGQAIAQPDDSEDPTSG